MDESAQFDTFRIGGDFAICSEQGLRIDAAVEMPDWEVRHFRKVVVIFREKPFYLSGKRPLPNGKIQYQLKPWAQGSQEIPGKIIYYDADYVQSRDQSNRVYKRRKYEFLFLRPFSPLIGFLWSETKARLDGAVWISARRATIYSILLELTCSLVSAVLLVITLVVGAYFAARSGRPVFVIEPLPLCLLLVFTAPDGVVRLHHILEENGNYYGFHEWLFKRARKRGGNA